MSHKSVAPVPLQDSFSSIRVALYSHDTCGLGHLRRNMLIARRLRRELLANVLIISGIREAGAFPLEQGIDTLLLPALSKKGNLDYIPRRLDLSLKEVVAVRSGAIGAALHAFDPDVFIVDNVPRGAVAELDPVLRSLRPRHSVYCVLGLRDVLDRPEQVHREWEASASLAAIREHYDAVWIYGDPSVYDGAAEYGFPADVHRKLQYTGYLNPLAHQPPHKETTMRSNEQRDVCVVGGGHDGSRIALAFAAASAETSRPGLVLTGPFMSAEHLRELQSATRTDATVVVRRFVPNPLPLYRGAHNVVSMGGYNTLLEVLAVGKRPLVVPRIEPRCEQLIRAGAFERLGLVDVLHPSMLTPATVRQWLDVRHESRPDTPARIAMDGLDKIVEMVRHIGLNDTHSLQSTAV